MTPNRPNEMEKLTEAITKCLFAIERVERVLTNNEMNNDKGLVAQVQEHDERLTEMEAFCKVYEHERTQSEKRINRNFAIIGLAFVIIQIFISIKKP